MLKRLPGHARQWKNIYLARHLPVKKASTAGIVGGRRRRIAKAMEPKGGTPESP